jgi:hypothetical protein
MMNKALRWLGIGVLVTLAIRIADWLLFPALPLLVTLLVIGVVLRIAINGMRGL